jgi:hypothetical protein
MLGGLDGVMVLSRAGGEVMIEAWSAVVVVVVCCRSWTWSHR